MYCDCGKSELSIFDPLPIQSVVLNAVWEDLFPLHSVVDNDSPIEYRIFGNDNTMLDLNDTMLVVKGNITRGNGTALVNADTVCPINYQLHSMFSDVQVRINDVKIEGGHFLHPYKAYISGLLQSSEEHQKCQMRAAGFVKDTAGKFDTLAENNGAAARKQLGVYTLAGPILSDFLQQGRYLMANTNVSIKLFRAKPTFFLQNTGGEFDYKYNMISCVLYVRRCIVNPSVLTGHLKGLQHRPAQYPIQHTEMQTLTVSQGIQSVVKDNLFNGKTAKLVIIGLVLNTSFNGTYASNPFHFHHFNLSEIVLYKNGESCPFRPLSPTWNEGVGREYMSLFQSLNMYNTPAISNGLTLNEFQNGYTFFAFNLCPDLDFSGSHGQIKNVPNIRLEMKFTQALAHPLNIVLYSIGDNIITIDRDGIVMIKE